MKTAHEQRSWIENAAVLSQYLPAEVADQVLRAQRDRLASPELGGYVAQLQDLLHSVVSFVPEYADITHRTLPAPQPGVLRTTEGALLAADLSGFTAFSARLSTLGGEGAELVARTINALFSALIETLAHWDGRLLKLSGDALTALFSGPDYLWRAVTAALALQARMAAFAALDTPAGTFTLRIRIGLASGEVQLVQLGSPERVELLVAGGTASRAMAYQRYARPGAVVIGPRCYQALAPHCRTVRPLGGGLYRVDAAEPAEPPTLPEPFTWVTRSAPAWEIQALIGRIELLRPYLIDRHLARLADGPLPLTSEGDLRPVTVLFANLHDAGAPIEQAQPAQRGELIAQIQARAQQIWQTVAHYGGTINKLDLHLDGHTLVVLFGAPLAQAHDAERAVSCAHALMQQLGAPAQAGELPAPLQVRRIGVTTGRVFAGAVGSPDRREYTVMGSVVNLAARLMDAAGSGQVLLDVATAQAVERRFRLLAQPPMSIKGYEQPLPLFALAHEHDTPLSLLNRPQGPLVGRERELARARAAIERARGGQAALVALLGEAGIGKSRLLAELVHGDLLAQAPAPELVLAQAQPYGQVRPYALLAELLRQLFDLPERPEPAARALAGHALRLAPEHERFLPLLPTVLGLPGDDSPLTQALLPDERRARLHELLVALLRRRAAAPLALVLEDLHWADAASLSVLDALAAVAQRLPLLLLCTYRPEGAPAWPAASAGQVEQIELAALTAAQSDRLIRAGAPGLAGPLRQALIERTQGNPFFIEEAARALREHDLAGTEAPPLPATIQAALMARLDRLPPAERYMLQVAAVIGPQFDLALLGGIAGAHVPAEPTLALLLERGLVRPIGDDRFHFVHSLTQETLYESLLFAQRRDTHRQIAEYLRLADPERADAEPGLLAFHYRRAEAWPEALDYALSAGVRAQALYAGEIALAHYRDALEAAARCEGAIGAQSRPPILRRIGDLHALAGRFADAVACYDDALVESTDRHERAEILIAWTEICEGQAAYDEALRLLDQAAHLPGPGDEDLALRLAVRRAWVLARSGANEAARAAVEPCLAELEARECWADLVLANKVFFHIAMSQSRWREAHAYLASAIRNAEHAGDLREIGRLRNNMGIVLTQEGDLRAAARECERAATVMRDIGDQLTLASVEVNIGVIHYKIGNFAAALEHYQASLQSAIACGALPIECIVYNNFGEIYRRLGQLPESLDQLNRSIELCVQTQDELGLSEAQRQRAETLIAMNQLEAAEGACAEALRWARAASDAQAEAIAYRARGMLAAARADYAGAQVDTQRSIQMLTDLGCNQELGQSMVVEAGIWQATRRADLAEQLLEQAKALFRQSGATADLAQANALLDALRSEKLAAKVHV